MNEQLRKHLDHIFQNAPKTRAALELKEELLANSSERYQDLIASGISEQDALDNVISSIGDVNELLLTLQAHEVSGNLSQEIIKKVAVLKSVATAIFILSVVALIGIDSLLPWTNLGIIVMLIMIAIGVCIMVYTNTAYPRYVKKEDSVVEDFKEWNHNQKHLKSIKASVNTILWMAILVLYFVISFVTMAWYITWVIFLIGACAQGIVNLLFQLKNFQD